ncbi:prevent-host-death protein [Actinotignum schaalii]|uniref:prevent-host-death protein n=1 Tax=Actinotignum schaalii TaxID=59505 RepID=UPI000429BD04|nr:prevent-host-death protein [Actinotignum schaalii]AIE83133.1 prevent-host-death protein [Actinotignum schaalii]WQN45305.1 type II toxin-antitoxin system Phd/YefM family antitoxin [Actinotignum schaalii]
MNVNTNTLVPISEANQNFSKVARLVDEYGSAVILKNNRPRYIITEFAKADEIAEPDDAELAKVSAALIRKNARVYEELAK